MAHDMLCVKRPYGTTRSAQGAGSERQGAVEARAAVATVDRSGDLAGAARPGGPPGCLSVRCAARAVVVVAARLGMRTRRVGAAGHPLASAAESHRRAQHA